MHPIRNLLSRWVMAVMVLGTLLSFAWKEQQERHVHQLVEQELASQAINLTDAIVDRLYRMRHGLRALELMASHRTNDTTLEQLLTPFEHDLSFALDMVGAESYGLVQENGAIRLMSLTEKPLLPQEHWLRQASILQGLIQARRPQLVDRPLVFTPDTTPSSLTILLLPASTSSSAPGLATWVYLSVNLKAALSTWNLDPDQLSLRIVDVSRPKEPHLLLAPEAKLADSSWRWQSTREVWGSRWRFEIRTQTPPPIPPGVLSPNQALGAGLGSTAVLSLAAAAWSQLRRQRRQVERRQLQFASLVDNASDAFVIHDQQGRIHRVNQAAHELLGWPAETWTRLSWSDLLSDADRRPYVQERLLAQEPAKQAQEANLKTKSGTLVPVSISSFVVSDQDDEPLICRIIRDHRLEQSKRTRLQEAADLLSQQVAQRTEESRLATQRLQSVLDSLPAAIAYWNADLANEFANQSYLGWFAPSGQLPGHDDLMAAWQTANPSLDLQAHWTKALHGLNQVFRLTDRANPSPTERHLECHWIPDLRAGRVNGVYELIIDVSELKDSQRQLVETSRLQDALMQALQMHTIYSVTDTQGTILEVNDAFCRISGYEREELVGRNHRIVNSGAHTDAFWRSMWQTALSGERWHGEVCNRNKSGELYWVDSIVAPFRGASGEIERLISLRTDITALKMAEQRLRIASEGFSERAGQIAGVGGWEIDLTTGEMTLTRHARHIFGIEDDQAMNLESSLASFPPDARDELRRAIFTAIQKGKGWDLELPLIQHQGQQIWVRSIGELEYGEDGLNAQRLVGAMQDVTAKHLANQALRDASTLAQQANQAKTDFLANMSHEIRTPLNAMIGMAHVLAQSIREPEHLSWVQKIQTSGMTLLSLINDILDLSKIEAGELSLVQEPFSLRRLMADVAELLSNQALSHGLSFDTVVESDVPDQLIGDSHRIRQVLINLVGNAVKFTRSGSVHVRVKLLSSQLQRVRIVLAVQDTGIGISQEALAKLFTPFSQADASTTREFGGTGLGLSIVRRLVNLMNGHIEVESSPGVGSTFSVQLPLSKADASQTKLMTQNGFVVGCAPALLPYLADTLDQLGWHLQQQSPASSPSSNHLFLIDDSLLADAQAQGAPYLVCPLSQANALQLFNNACEALRQHGRDEQVLFAHTHLDTLRAWSLAGVRVLAVDDSDINREVLVRLLGAEGALVQEAYDGQKALQMLETSPHPFDVVLMDIQMPVLDGVQATLRIRRDPRWEQLPVIALTAGVLSSEKERAWDAGMNDFLGKPIDPAALIAVIRKWVQSHRQQALPLLPRPTSESGSGGDWQTLPGINLALAQRTFMHDARVHRMLLTRLIDTYRPVFEAAERGEGPLHDEGTRAATLHKFAGAAATLGASDLETLARRAMAALDAEPHATVSVECMAISELLAELTQALHLNASAQMTPSSPNLELAWDPAQVDTLRQAIRHQRFDALKIFESLREMLAQHLGADACAVLGQHLVQLNFPAALQHLETALSACERQDA